MYKKYKQHDCPKFNNIKICIIRDSVNDSFFFFFLPSVVLVSSQTATDVWRQVHRVAFRMIIIVLSSAFGSLIVDHAI